jgi:BirA family transcriptional regulator, biotin operon repressor / biotin---[acetyl-CoA-carboxylase] ligase
LTAWSVHRLGIIDSTSTEAKRRASLGFDDQWLLADQQTAGRGRQDRTWLSPAGNLYATALYHEPGGLPAALRMPFAAALALSDVIQLLLPEAEIRLKWPNDVRCAKHKLAGILVETGGADGALWVAVGIGLNIRVMPAETGQPATCLAELGLSALQSRDTVFDGLQRAFAARLAQARSGFDEIRRDWLERAEGLGDELQLQVGGERVSGRFLGLGPEGALLLGLPDGATRAIWAGEIVSFGS